MSFALLSVAALIAARPSLGQPGSAQLRGAIVDQADNPVAGAKVTLIRQVQAAQGSMGKRRSVSPAVAAQAISDVAGNYRLLGLAPASYDICIEAPGYLTTCEWDQWSRAALTAGASVDHGRLRLTKAALVTVRIDDPSDLLRSAGRISYPLIAVRDQFSRVHSARKIATEGKTHSFQVEVPYETQLVLRIQSARFLLKDTQGRDIGLLGADVPFRAQQGAAAPVFTFTIAGERSQPEWPPRSLPPAGAVAP